MALKVGELYAALGLDSKSFNKGLDSSKSRAKGWAGGIGAVFRSAGKAIAAGLLIGITAISAIGVASSRNAEEQERANDRVAAAFGASGDAINKWAADNARAFGVADDVLQQSVAKYGTWAKNVGFTTKEAASQGEALAQRASEISLATGKSFDEVFAALMKGAQGSTRGLKEFGVAVSPLAIKNEALRLGLIKSGEALDDHAKAAALNSLIMQQTAGFTQLAADAQGSMADKSREMGVMVDEIMDTVGVAFLTLATTILPYVVDAFAGLSAWVTANMPMIQAVVETILNAIGTAFTFFSDVIVPVLTAAFKWIADNVFPIFNQAAGTVTEDVMPALSEAFRVITEEVIPALGDVFDWIITNILPPVQAMFQAFTENILPTLALAFDTIVKVVKDNWPTIQSIVEQVGGAIKRVVEVISAVIQAVYPVIKKLAEVIFPILGAAAGVLLKVIDGAFKLIGGAFQLAFDIGKAVVDGLSKAWNGLVGVLSFVGDTIKSVFKTAMNFLVGIVNGVIKAVNSIQVHIGRIGLDTPAGFIGVGPFDWNGLQLKQLPYLAKGTPWFPGGRAIVGERGPELVNLPRGSEVIPADKTRDMMRGGDGSSGAPMIGQQNIYGVQPGDVERETKRALRRANLTWALEGR